MGQDELLREAGDLAPALEELFHTIHQNPELGRREYRTAALIRRRLDSGAKRVTIHLPYDKGGALEALYRDAKVEKVDYSATIDVVAVCTPRTIGQLKDYVEGYEPPKEPWED